MADLQGIATFPGIDQIVRATYTLGHGIHPGVAMIECVPQKIFPSEAGTLRFFFGDTEIELRDCIIDEGSLQGSEDGYVTSLSILDRRWKWKYGEIFGEYNFRNANKRVVRRTRKETRELAELLLEQMGEPIDAAAVIATKPKLYVNWVGANPARELDKLCESIGYGIVLRINGDVRIDQIGIGADLPGDPVMQFTAGLNPPDKPDNFLVIGASTRFQAQLKLIPVGLDVDGKVVPIDDLTYKPAGGWNNIPPDDLETNMVGSSDEAKRRALFTVWKWFAINLNDKPSDTDAKLDLPANLNVPTLTDRQAILPISPELVETETVNNVVQRQHAKIHGVFEQSVMSAFSNSDEKYDITTQTFVATGVHKRLIPCKKEFQLNEDYGFVMFDEPVWKWDRANTTFVAPDIFLTCSFNLRFIKNTGELHRYQLIIGTGGKKAKTGAEVLDLQETLQILAYQTVPNMKWVFVESLESLDTDAKDYANQYLKRYINVESGDAMYAGLLAVSPDGAIRQVTWDVGPSGATTRIARNSETIPYIPSTKFLRKLDAMSDLEPNVKTRLPPLPKQEVV